MAKLTPDELSEAPQPPEDREAVVLGKRKKGDRALPLRDGQAMWPFDLLLLQLIILGKIGQGKTTTALRIACEIATKIGDAQIFCFDGNADFKFGRRFCGAMNSTGRRVAVFPHQRFNGWPKSWLATYNRLLSVIRFAEEGPATFYTDAGALALRLACRLREEPPSSTKDLLTRLDPSTLMSAYSPDELLGLDAKEIKSVRMRVNSVYGSVGSAFDGDWSFRDVDAAYFGIDPLAFKKTEGVVLQMLLSELEHYVKYEKDPERLCVVMIDEYASLAGVADVAMFVEQARKLGVCVILLSQTVAGLGNEVQKRRLMYNVGMVLTHRTHEYRELLDLIAMQRAPDLTMRYLEEVGLEPDRIRQVEEPKVKQGDLMGLAEGESYLFVNDKAMMVEIEKPDESGYSSFELPEQEELFEPMGKHRPKDGKPTKIPDFLLEGDLGKSAFSGARFAGQGGAGEQIPTEESASDGDPPADEEDSKSK